MNIFILDENPVLAAQMQCDKHVVKMILESAQMLCSPFNNGAAPYKRTHYNHPCSIWARTSKQNYEWLMEHASALCVEYTKRYGKNHKSETVLEWCFDHYENLNLPDIGLTPFAQAMPDMYKSTDVVEAYRKYYRGEKGSIAKWAKNRKAPDWW